MQSNALMLLLRIRTPNIPIHLFIDNLFWFLFSHERSKNDRHSVWIRKLLFRVRKISFVDSIKLMLREHAYVTEVTLKYPRREESFNRLKSKFLLKCQGRNRDHFSNPIPQSFPLKLSLLSFTLSPGRVLVLWFSLKASQYTRIHCSNLMKIVNRCLKRVNTKRSKENIFDDEDYLCRRKTIHATCSLYWPN